MEYPACRARLDGKVALVTGSTHGIGRGVAERLAREGATIVVNDAGELDGEAVAAELPGDAIYVEADVGDPSAIERLVDRTASTFDQIDVIVNNVGEARLGPPEDVTIEDWAYTFDVCLRSQWLTVKHALEHLSTGASVVNISSANAWGGAPGFFPYNVAKAGVNGLTRSLAVELGPLDVRVNAVEPGMIDVENPDATPAELGQDKTIDPAGRDGTPADVAGLVAYLASDESSFVTGATIPVDGGRHAVLVDDQYADHYRFSK